MVALSNKSVTVIAIDDKAAVFRDNIEKQIEIHKTLGIGTGRDGEIWKGKFFPIRSKLNCASIKGCRLTSRGISSARSKDPNV
jgi:hypothetical protein